LCHGDPRYLPGVDGRVEQLELGSDERGVVRCLGDLDDVSPDDGGPGKVTS
jgi:hypothetical protein